MESEETVKIKEEPLLISQNEEIFIKSELEEEEEEEEDHHQSLEEDVSSLNTVDSITLLPSNTIQHVVYVQEYPESSSGLENHENSASENYEIEEKLETNVLIGEETIPPLNGPRSRRPSLSSIEKIIQSVAQGTELLENNSEEEIGKKEEKYKKNVKTMKLKRRLKRKLAGPENKAVKEKSSKMMELLDRVNSSPVSEREGDSGERKLSGAEKTNMVSQPMTDLVRLLIENQFFNWSEKNKIDVLNEEPPRPELVRIFEELNDGKKHNRNFQMVWYKLYPWLCGSLYMNRLFCWPCLIVGVRKTVWNNVGFQNIAVCTRAFHKHENSVEHMKNTIAFKSLKKKMRICGVLQSTSRLVTARFNENVSLNRQVMTVIIRAVLYLIEQEFLFESFDSTTSKVGISSTKLTKLLDLVMETSGSELKQHYNKVVQHLFKDGELIKLQNKIIDCVGNLMKSYIEQELDFAECFSIQFNDANDSTQGYASFFSIVFRFVNEKGLLVERFYGFHPIDPGRRVNSLMRFFNENWEKLDFEKKLVGQCYDGTNIIGKTLINLKEKVLEKAPQAFLVFSLGDRLNGVLKQAVSSIPECKYFIANIISLPLFFCNVTKRCTSIFTFTFTSRLLSLVDLGWSKLCSLLNLVAENWVEMIDCFRVVIKDPFSESQYMQRAKEYLKDFISFDFIFLSIILKHTFQLVDPLYDILNDKGFDVKYCVQKIHDTKESIMQLKNDSHFDEFFVAAEKVLIDNLKQCWDIVVRRAKFDKFKFIYFKIILNLRSEFEIRFADYKRLEVISLADSTKFQSYHDEFPNKILDAIKVCPYFDKYRLKSDLVDIYTEKSYRDMSPQEIITAMDTDDFTSILKESYKFFCFVLALPCVRSSIEENSCCLQRIRSFLSKCSIREQQCELFAVTTIEKQLIDELIETTPFFDDVINKLAAMDCEVDLMYKKVPE